MTIEQHATEVERNQTAWNERPLLRDVYAGFYERIAAAIAPLPAGPVMRGVGAVLSRAPRLFAGRCLVVLEKR
jgi:hypothetical protein